MTPKEEIEDWLKSKKKEQEKREASGKLYSIKIDDEIQVLEKVLIILNK